MDRIYIETSVVVDYIKMKIKKDRDLVANFKRELVKLRNLKSKFSFVILESSLGEAIGQCLKKGWKDQDVFEALSCFLRETGAEIVRSGKTNTNPWNEEYNVFERANKIIEVEWSGESHWGMDIHDIWFLSQVSLDPDCKYIWTRDRRILDYGSTYIEMVCERKINVVETLAGIK